MMLSLNTQPVEHQIFDPSGALDVINTFPTIQGEGPFAGEPAVFLRLAGCNLSASCRLCDTDYTSNRACCPPDELAANVSSLMPSKANLVVLTGGEPLRQNLLPLIRRLKDLKYRIQIETNGTLFLQGLEFIPEHALTIVCSPKTGKINSELMPLVNALKYVVTAGKVDPEDGLPIDSLGAGVKVQRPWHAFKGQVYVQPCDEGCPEKNKANLEEAVRSCMKHGYRLSVQIHKIANLP